MPIRKKITPASIKKGIATRDGFAILAKTIVGNTWIPRDEVIIIEIPAKPRQTAIGTPQIRRRKKMP